MLTVVVQEFQPDFFLIKAPNHLILFFLIHPKVWLPADASDFILQSALNDLWSIKPDAVQVVRTQNPQSYVYMVTFISTRGKHVFHFAIL